MIKVLLDQPHGIETPGKRSPDGKLREYAWGREICPRIEAELKKHGVNVAILNHGDRDVPLRERVAAVNNQCKVLGSKNVLLVSVHINAAGSGAQWMNARGWSVFVSKNASAASKEMAQIMTAKAKKRGLLCHGIMGTKGYATWSWTSADIYILKNTNCPAILSENFFQDNKEDAAWLMSEQGKECIVNLHVDSILEYIKTHNNG